MKTPVILVLALISVLSLILGLIKYGSLSESTVDKEGNLKLKDAVWQLRFVEIWNCFTNFLIAGLIGYYLIAVRWPVLREGQSPGAGDFILLVILMLGVFGHLVVMSKNITEGINAILRRVLDK